MDSLANPSLRIVGDAEWEASAQDIIRRGLIREAHELLPSDQAEAVLRGEVVEYELPSDLPEAEQSKLASRWFAFAGDLQRYFRRYGRVAR